ncbi:MAG: hypothetical protein ACTSPC_04270 [Candidatus Heimdallarchaeota archaeon]
MPVITENTVMEFYLNLVKEDRVQFLIKQKELKKIIIKDIKKLQKESDIHDKIKTAKDLWKALFEAAMTYIDPDKHGFDKLFKYFNQFVEFEELIFASDSFYRDHTLHCLWVYFLGEYVFHNPEFSSLFINKEREIKNTSKFREVLLSLEQPNIFGNFIRQLDNIIGILELDDSIRCVIALAHDLGYPLKKIDKINTEIGKLLPFFAISEFSKFAFEYENIQQFFLENFLQLISDDIGMTVDSSGLEFDEQQLIATYYNRIGQISSMIEQEIEPDPQIIQELKDSLDGIPEKEKYLLRKIFFGKGKIDRSMSQVLRYANDFEEYKHGIMSSYLLMKLLNSFSNIQITYSNPNDLPLEDLDFATIYGKMKILKAMADHTSSGYQITDFDNYSAQLILIDEIEEFSRISRANQYRTFVNQFCKCELDMSGKCICIDFIFDDDNIDDLNPSIAFKDKCRRFISVFDIPNLTDNISIRFRCIAKLKKDKKIYELQLSRNHVKISINDVEEKDINKYLKTKEFARDNYKKIR